VSENLPFHLHLEPLLICVVVLFAYTRGVQHLWLRMGVGRGVSPMRALAFCTGLLLVATALTLPMEHTFTLHMTQHVLITIPAAYLIVFGEPLAVLVQNIPPMHRPALGRQMKRGNVMLGRAANPVLIWLLHTGVMWLWHVPGLYDAALRAEAVHILEHATMLAVALLYWWSVRRGSRATAVLSLFATGVQCSILGALITFAPRTLYTSYAVLSDQQIAGLIMWVPAGMAYVGAGLFAFASLLNMDAPREPIPLRIPDAEDA
jgi:putative membrane protein